MKITFLGTGTSSGVPVIACSCQVCSSEKAVDKRLRSSILLEQDNYTMIIDMTPDFRQQALRKKIKNLDSVLLTHDHADHLFGLDDIRQLSWNKTIPVYTNKTCQKAVFKRFDYIFRKTQKGGGKPKIEVFRLPDGPFRLGPFTVQEIPVYHGKLLISGFRINNIAYITDCSCMSEKSAALLQGLDLLVINSLRAKHHPTHYSHEETIAEIKRLSPGKAYITHLTHNHSHSELTEIFNGYALPAYDGLELTI